MKSRTLILGIFGMSFLWGKDLYAQDKLYPNTFPLSEVTLLDGPFKHAQDLNVGVLLQYDTDRLLAPFLKEAGLPMKADVFPNWEGLDGHVGGHYLSALAIHYASTGNEECGRRLEYMLSELKKCQDKTGGYIGGIPNGMALWNEIKKGNVGAIWKYWAPWYNVHKMFAGLRDAWLYAGNEDARQMFLKLCDWGLTVITPLSDEQMEQMLENEFGGMDEVYADAYQMTQDKKYLDAAKRFSHHWLLDSMAAGIDNLDNKHANTQVPKAIGYQRIAELDHNRTYEDAASFFWHTVVDNRSLAFGGNSRREHFAAKEDCRSYVEEREGPESCNTYNMLKLTEGLFRMHPSAGYADFYERALFNHILSTQHPEHGGYVYFTSARPAHYRVYSAPNKAMWCCVGTGMENHGKYGEFIYTHAHDSLFVNLFVASELNWKEAGIRLRQDTRFPVEEGSRITVSVEGKKRFKLLVRHPGWVKNSEMKVVCGGKEYASQSESSSYVCIDREWKDGDLVEIRTPMHVEVEELPNVSEYIAIMRGPILLGARMGTENLDGLVADDSRWGHIASGALVPVYETPFIIGERKDIVEKLNHMIPVEGKPLCYTVPGLFRVPQGKQEVMLEPFYGIHDSRYAIYWLSMNEEGYARYQDAMKKEEEKRIALDRRTVDAVATGEQQPEIDHQMVSENSTKGNFEGEAWRDARDGGYFGYTLSTGGKKDLSLMIRYWGNETADREFDILVDGKVLASENLVGKWSRREFVNVEYSIPSAMLDGKQEINVMFRPKPGKIAGGIFFIRLLKK